MDRIGESANSGNELVIRESRLMPTRCPNWPGNSPGASDNHGSAARGSSGVMRNFTVTDFTFDAKIHIHRWKEHTIAQIKTRNATRSKKSTEICGRHQSIFR
jgi:hypothetical protein